MLRLFLLWMPLCLSLTWTAGLPSTSDMDELQAGKAITEPMPRFRATTLDGRQLDSRALKGKVVVLKVHLFKTTSFFVWAPHGAGLLA